MAVRDEGQQPTEIKKTGRTPLWRDTLGHAPAVLLVGGLLMYGYLSVCYDRFYGSLGVDPNDVGLTYAGTLAHSSGFAILSLVVLANIPTGVLAIQRDDRRARREDPTAQTPRILVVLMVLTSVAWIFTALRPPFLSAGYAARYVRTGVPVSPIRVWSIPVLAIHADPATVEPAGKPGDSPAAERLRSQADPDPAAKAPEREVGRPDPARQQVFFFDDLPPRTGQRPEQRVVDMVDDDLVRVGPAGVTVDALAQQSAALEVAVVARRDQGIASLDFYHVGSPDH